MCDEVPGTGDCGARYLRSAPKGQSNSAQGKRSAALGMRRVWDRALNGRGEREHHVTIMQLKRGTSKWIKSKGPGFRYFGWQNGYGAFSVSQSLAGDVQDYIARPAEHHRKITFQDELRRFLQRHEIEFDERYVWD